MAEQRSDKQLEKPKRKLTRYTPLPKTPDGKLDREALKAAYMAHPAITWRDFARDNNYDARNLVDDVPWKSWREEKIAQVLHEAGQDAEEKAVRARTQIVFQQLRALEDLPSNLFRTLRLYEYINRQHEQDAYEDMRARQDGRAQQPGWAPKFRLTHDELMLLTVAGEKLTNSIHKALMLKDDQPAIAMNLIQQVKAIADQQASQKQGAGAQSVEVMGMAVRSMAELTQELSGYYDKPQAPQVLPPAPAPTVVSPEDQDDDSDEVGGHAGSFDASE